MADKDWLAYVVLAIAVVSIALALVILADTGVAGPWATVASNIAGLTALLTFFGIIVFAVFTFRG